MGRFGDIQGYTGRYGEIGISNATRIASTTSASPTAAAPARPPLLMAKVTWPAAFACSASQMVVAGVPTC